jgi:flagellar assembly factor FliW
MKCLTLTDIEAPAMATASALRFPTGPRATVNLEGPIVTNRYKLTSKQVVLANASEHAVKDPSPVSEVNA